MISLETRSERKKRVNLDLYDATQTTQVLVESCIASNCSATNSSIANKHQA